ncbi:hypothetical protein CRG98_005476 [Punica granatum]|uniref:Retrotransposon gag domain-containing protein n=1 Tax=Punica granatum TaxID=22663 RepID=A0A2I0L077_PUNGR|nr:hypothetical protein CRG98_005476 [Punica granatum]
MTPTTASYQRDACHGFLLLVFGTLMFPYSPNLIDGAIAQVVLQAMGGHSYVEALLAETVRSLDYVREVRRGRMRGSLHLLQTWLLAHVCPFCSSHPFSYISDERSLIERLAPVIPPPEHSFSEWRRFWRELTPARFLWVARWNPGGPMITGCPGIVGVPLLGHLGSTLIFPGRGSTPPQRSQATLIPRATSTLAPEAESSIQVAMHAELRAVREERDRLRCELVNSRAEVADYKELQTELTRAHARVAHLDREMAQYRMVLTHSWNLGDHNWRRTVTRLVNVSGWLKGIKSISPKKSTHRFRLTLNHPRRTLHHLPLLQAYSRPLEGTVNQMATNMAELLALLRGPIRASSSSTPPPGQGPTTEPTPWISPTQAPENMELPAPSTLHTHDLHNTSPDGFPGAQCTCSDSSSSLRSSLPICLYSLTSASPTRHPPINTTFHEPGTPTHAAQFASLTHSFPEADVEQERRLRRMEKTIGPYERAMLVPTHAMATAAYSRDSLSGSALDWFMSLKAEDIPTWEDLSRKLTNQYRYCAETPPTLLELSTKEMAQGQRFEEYATKWGAQAAKHIPPISEAQQIQLFSSTLRGLLGLLSRHNESHPHKVNRAVQRNRDPADNTRPCRSHFSTFTGKFVTRSGQQRPARTSIQPSKIRASNASTIEGHRGTP